MIFSREGSADLFFKVCGFSLPLADEQRTYKTGPRAVAEEGEPKVRSGAKLSTKRSDDGQQV